uniref:Uncharacterized protein n=1 Tax=Amphimedon queenslandica TaxID=400682 RepID=A0A1X7TCW3_AMPQE
MLNETRAFPAVALHCELCSPLPPLTGQLSVICLRKLFKNFYTIIYYLSKGKFDPTALAEKVHCLRATLAKS